MKIHDITNLQEAFDRPYDYKWDKLDFRNSEATFITSDEIVYDVTFEIVEDHPSTIYYLLEFLPDDQLIDFDRTENYDIRVFSTIIVIIKDFLSHFDGAVRVVGFDKKMHQFYTKLAKRYAFKHKLKILDVSSYAFDVIKEDVSRNMMKLQEAFDKPYDYKWEVFKRHSAEASFLTSDNIEYSVWFSMSRDRDGFHTVDFVNVDQPESMKDVKLYDIKVFSTVLDIIKDFLAHFGGIVNVVGGYPKLFKLYKRIAKQYAAKNRMKVTISSPNSLELQRESKEIDVKSLIQEFMIIESSFADNFFNKYKGVLREILDEIKIPRFLYHLTPRTRIPQILNDGLKVRQKRVGSLDLENFYEPKGLYLSSKPSKVVLSGTRIPNAALLTIDSRKLDKKKLSLDPEFYNIYLNDYTTREMIYGFKEKSMDVHLIYPEDIPVSAIYKIDRKYIGNLDFQR